MFIISVIKKIVPSQTPTVATSSRCKLFAMSGIFTCTGESIAGVIWPSARASKVAHSFLNQSTATLMALSALAYSSCAALLVIGCLELGIKAAVDLTLFFLVAKLWQFQCGSWVKRAVEFVNLDALSPSPQFNLPWSCQPRRSLRTENSPSRVNNSG